VRLDHSCQVQRRTHAERGHDLYETPRVAVAALLDVEPLPARIGEPAVGRGAIARVLESAGHEAIGTDLIGYGAGYLGGIDFLQERVPRASCIVTNPPFRIADTFVARALDLAPTVIMLLRLALLESERRTGILEGRGLRRIHVSTPHDAPRSMGGPQGQ